MHSFPRAALCQTQHKAPQTHCCRNLLLIAGSTQSDHRTCTPALWQPQPSIPSTQQNRQHSRPEAAGLCDAGLDACGLATVGAALRAHVLHLPAPRLGLLLEALLGLDARVLDVLAPVRRQAPVLLDRAAHRPRARHRLVRQRRVRRRRRISVKSTLSRLGLCTFWHEFQLSRYSGAYGLLRRCLVSNSFLHAPAGLEEQQTPGMRMHEKRRQLRTSPCGRPSLTRRRTRPAGRSRHHLHPPQSRRPHCRRRRRRPPQSRHPAVGASSGRRLAALSERQSQDRPHPCRPAQTASPAPGRRQSPHKSVQVLLQARATSSYDGAL